MIRIHEVHKSYGPNPVLRGLSLHVPEHGSAIVMGPSGSGKSTLLRLVAGLEKPEQGTIHLQQKLASTPHYVLPPFQRGIGMVFQSAALWPHMTVIENILFGINRRDRQGAARRIGDLLEMLEIASLSRSYPRQLSGGQARRVAIARALAPSPRLLLLDEPFTNMDERLRCEVLACIRSEYEKHGLTMLLVTHDPNEARALPGSVWQLTGGTVEMVLDHPAGASHA